MHSSHPRLVPYLVMSLVFFVVGCPTAAADGGPDIRSAGGEEQFRVIDRFPDASASSVEVPTVDRGDPFYPVIDRVEHQAWSDALALLAGDEIMATLSATPTKRFLSGYIALEAGEPSRALGYFEGLEDELPSLGDYRAYYVARAAFKTDDFHRATLEAASVPGDSPLYADALYLLARALLESGEREDIERAVEVMELYLTRYDSRNDAPRLRLLLGETLESMGRPDDAAGAYLALRNEHPLRSEADTAGERLQSLSDSGGLSPSVVARIEDRDSVDRIMNRVRALHRIHRSETVIDEFKNKVDDFPTNARSEYCETLYKISDSHTKLRRHSDAIPWYDRVLDECSDVENYEIRALYRTARSRWNAGLRDDALDHWERLWTDFPDHSFADDAMYFAGRILRSEDRHDEARKILHRQVETYPDGDMAKDAHWLLVRDFFEQQDYDGAVDYIDGLDETGEDDLYSRGRLHYFRGRALEKGGDTEAATEALEEVARNYPKTYYALLAINRLARLGGDEGTVCEAAGDICDELLSTDRNASAIDIPDRLRRDRAFDRGTTLLSLGLISAARTEFSDLRSRHAGSDSTLWAMASLLDRAGAHPISHDIARRHIDGWMNQYPDQASRARWEVAYPTPFRDIVTKWADQREGLNAAKIYAIMREESGFNPRIESWANARGLLQLLDDTASRMASRDDLSPYSVDRLYDPDINVRLGTAYMENLGERLDFHPALVSAGYNGGYGNVSNWLDAFGDEPLDLFVEDIPFHQTRNYTKRVMMSYWIYSYLYGDERVPRLAFSLPQ